MTQKELIKICKRCKINDPDECVECEYMKRADRQRQAVAKEAKLDFIMGMEAMGVINGNKIIK